MRAPDPIPVDLRDRIMRAREAVSAASRLNITDLRRYWRSNAAAKRELANAYKAAYDLAPPGTVMSVALLDAYAGLVDATFDAEIKARQPVPGIYVAEAQPRAKSRGQA